MIDLLRKVHAWIGISTAIIIFIVSLSGILLVWKPQYLWLTIPEARQQLDSSQLDSSAERYATITRSSLQKFADSLSYMRFADASIRLNKLYLQDRHYAYTSVDGEVIDVWKTSDRPEEWLYDFHHRLELESFGLYLVGFTGLLLMVSVPIGVGVFLPRRGGFLKTKTWVTSVPALLRRAHRDIGVLMALPILVTLVTGVILVFPQESQSLFGIKYSDKKDLQVTGLLASQRVEAKEFAAARLDGSWEGAFAAAGAIFPKAQIKTLAFASDLSPQVKISVQEVGSFNSLGVSAVTFSADLSQIMHVSYEQDMTPSIWWYQFVYPLHIGRFNSTLYALALTLVGIALMYLSVSGSKSFLSTLRKN